MTIGVPPKKRPIKKKDMRRLIINLGLILWLIPASAMAEPVEDAILAKPQANDGVTHIDLSKTLSSKVFGELRLPFSWDAVETPNPPRIVVTEGLSKAPGVLTLDMLDVPAGVEEKDISQAVADSLAADLGARAEISVDKLGSKKKVDVYKASIVGKEGDVPRKCALEAVKTGKKLLVMTVCAHESRQYNPDLGKMLDEILLNMR